MRSAAKVKLSKVVVFFAITIAVLGFLPINNYIRRSTKDYGKWFWVGQTVLEGGDIYAPRGDGTFAFMYPPTAAVLFAILSYLGGWVWFWRALFLSVSHCRSPLFGPYRR